jgi:hypothetical protein
MTTYASPPTGYAPPPPTPPSPILPVRPDERPRWGLLVAAVALVLAAGAAAFSAAILVRPPSRAVHTVIMPPTAPTYSAADASAAKSRACAAWEVTSSTMAQASRSAATATSDWTDPQTRAAHGYEARTALVESSLLERSAPPRRPTSQPRSMTTWWRPSIRRTRPCAASGARSMLP